MNGHGNAIDQSEAVTSHNAAIMLDGIVTDIQRESGEAALDALRSGAALAASLCVQGWHDAPETFERLKQAAGHLDSAHVHGILVGEFAYIMPLVPVVDKTSGDVLAIARQAVAIAPDKVAGLQRAALDLFEHISAGRCSTADATDTLQDIAESHGLVDRLGADGVQHLISTGLQGRPALAPLCDLAQDQPDARPGSRLIVRCAADVTPKKVDWLWQDRIALGKQTLVGGEGGLSKSQFLAFLAAAVSTGSPWPADEGHAPLGNAIMFSAEDDADDTIVPRLLAAGADLKRIRIVEAASDGKGERLFDLQRDLERLEHEIADFGDVRLVTFDPVSSYLGGKVDGNSNNEIRRVLEPLSRIAARHRCAIVSLTHSPKGKPGRALNSFIGSAAFVNVVRAAYLVMRDPENSDRILFLSAKQNLAKGRDGLAYGIGVRDIGGEIFAPYLVWENETVSRTANEILAASGVPTDRSAREDAAEFLRTILADGAEPQKEVKAQADAAGITWASLKRAKHDIGIRAERQGGVAGAGRWFWALPGQFVADAKGLKNAYQAQASNVSPLAEIEPLSGDGGGQ